MKKAEREDAGHQPMFNEDRTIALVFNGEIYNFRELRKELKAMGHRFYSQTDTEVVIHAYESWGERCVLRFNGMFAFHYGEMVDTRHPDADCGGGKEMSGWQPKRHLTRLWNIIIKLYWFVTGATIIILFLMWTPDFVQWWALRYSDLPVHNTGDGLVKTAIGWIPAWFTLSVLGFGGWVACRGWRFKKVAK
jgi:hypothetical protein